MKEHPLIKALEDLEDAALGNDRLECLRDVDTPDLRKLLTYALSPDITFGVKQLPEPLDSQAASMGPAEWWETLVPLLEDLAVRNLTGGRAQTAIGSFLGLCSPLEQKWTERIIRQDLRLSIGPKDINKALGEEVIFKFEPPLAKQFKELKSLKGKWYVQPKMDGGRCIAVVSPKGPVRLKSRTWKEWGNVFDPIRRSLEEWRDMVKLKETICVDGELVVFKGKRMDFQAIQRLFHADDGRKPNGELKYIMFSAVPEREYMHPTKPYSEWLCNLRQTFGMDLPRNLQTVDTYLPTSGLMNPVENPDQKFLDDLAEKFVEKLGCDGAIIRRADAVPRLKKTSDITKIKPFEDAEATVVDKIEGTGWLEGSLGALVCQLKDGTRFKMGTGEGLDKQLRQELWDDPNTVGSLVNFKYQRLSDDGVPILITYRAIRHPDDVG